jgi:protein-S-isoprenylcysteine O-methyltransferase Ste14
MTGDAPRHSDGGREPRVDVVAFRVWPPVALGVPLLIGIFVTSALGDPWVLPAWTRWAGWALVAFFAGWNAWCLVLFERHRTGLLPGQPTTQLVDTGPFARSRNPLYVGLVALYLGISLLVPSVWSLVLLPVGVAALEWGAIRPEERYLRERFGPAYDAYCRRVRRWL